jgi:hypothetical protein
VFVDFLFRVCVCMCVVSVIRVYKIMRAHKSYAFYTDTGDNIYIYLLFVLLLYLLLY